MPEQLFGAIPLLRKQLAARNLVWLSFHRPSMSANAAVKSVDHVLRLCFLAAHLRHVKAKAGTAHEQLGRGSLAPGDVELGVIRTATTAAAA